MSGKSCGYGIPALISASIGAGLLAGAAGTAAFNASVSAQKQTTDEAPSTFPAQAAETMMGISFANPQQRVLFANILPWVYGSLLGLVRTILFIVGCKGIGASLVHSAVALSVPTLVLPRLNKGIAQQAAPPAVLRQALHHAVYGLVAGVVFDLLVHRRR